eukprot:scaffold6249_cov395-Prasinococcus_capsulatus_cf.AAC.8
MQQRPGRRERGGLFQHRLRRIGGLGIAARGLLLGGVARDAGPRAATASRAAGRCRGTWARPPRCAVRAAAAGAAAGAAARSAPGTARRAPAAPPPPVSWAPRRRAAAAPARAALPRACAGSCSRCLPAARAAPPGSRRAALHRRLPEVPWRPPATCDPGPSVARRPLCRFSRSVDAGTCARAPMLSPGGSKRCRRLTERPFHPWRQPVSRRAAAGAAGQPSAAV